MLFIKMRFLAVIVSCMVTASSSTQVQEAWVARYDGPLEWEDFATALALDPAGNVYVTGTSWAAGLGSDYTTLKYDPAGNLLWERRYDAPDNRTDVARALAVDGAGNVYVTGYSGGRADIATVKYDTDGNLLWQARYNGSGDRFDAGNAIAVDGLGNVFVTGRSDGAGSGPDIATLKYSPDGTLAWEARYSAASEERHDEAYALAVDESGAVYVAGASAVASSGVDYVTLKYAADGSLVWEARYNGPGNASDQANALARDGLGNIYVTGQSAGAGGGHDMATLKYRADGSLVWERRYNGPAGSFDAAFALAVDSEGNLYVGGESGTLVGHRDLAALKYRADGELLWDRHYDANAGFDIAFAIAVDRANSVYLAGFSEVAGLGPDYATLKYDADGNLLWAAHYNGPQDTWDAGRAIAVDSAGNVYVTGESGFGIFGSCEFFECLVDYATIKYVQEQRNDRPTYDVRIWVRRDGRPSSRAARR